MSKQNTNRPRVKREVPIQSTARYGFLTVLSGRQDDRGNIIGRNGMCWQDRRRAV